VDPGVSAGSPITVDVGLAVAAGPPVEVLVAAGTNVRVGITVSSDRIAVATKEIWVATAPGNAPQAIALPMSRTAMTTAADFCVIGFSSHDTWSDHFADHADISGRGTP